MADIQRKIALAEKQLQLQKEYLSDNETSLKYNQKQLEFYRDLVGRSIRSLGDSRLNDWLDIRALYNFRDSHKQLIDSVLEKEYQRVLGMSGYSSEDIETQITKYEKNVRYDIESVELTEMDIEALEFYLDHLRKQIDAD